MINRFLTGLPLLGVLFFLNACAPLHQEAKNRQVRTTCIEQCVFVAKACQHQCTDECHSCSKISQKEATQAYNHYLKERCVQGKTRILQLQSYRDPLQCLKKTCDCAADYRVCEASCRGQIKKQLQREMTCC